jgi:hypothetical protein
MDESPSHENPARIAGNQPRSEPGREFLERKSGELQRKLVLQKFVLKLYMLCAVKLAIMLHSYRTD